MKAKLISSAVIFAALLNTFAYAEPVDNQAYYASRPGQIFKANDILKTSGGYAEGDGVQYITWTGYISGVPVHVQIHGKELRIRVTEKIYEFSLRKASEIPGGDREYYMISDMGSDFYVKSMPNAQDSMICIESLGPDIYVPIIPYWEVYVIAYPLTHPELYRLSGINASCRGIERLPDGRIIAPKWTLNRRVTPSVVIDYYSLQKNTVRKNNIQVTGMIASEDGLEYVFNE